MSRLNSCNSFLVKKTQLTEDSVVLQTEMRKVLVRYFSFSVNFSSLEPRNRRLSFLFQFEKAWLSPLMTECGSYFLAGHRYSGYCLK